MRYSKQPLSVADQAKLLIDRGLICGDIPRLEHYLAHIGYYRLSAYWKQFEQKPPPGQPLQHKFKPNTSFEQILNLYIFDRKLRLMVLEAIERIEVAVRARWVSAMALNHGSHAHMRSDLFKCPWKHTRDIARIAGELEKSGESFVTHYRTNYHEPFLPPIWVVAETMSFGTLSRWLQYTQDTNLKKGIMRGLGMPTVEVMEGVLHALTPVRNVCAHHSRLWNRRFAMSLPAIKRIRDRLVPPNSPNHQDHHIYNYLVVVEFMLYSITPKSTWKRRLIALFDNMLTNDELRAMGFPNDWKTRKPWCKT